MVYRLSSNGTPNGKRTGTNDPYYARATAVLFFSLNTQTIATFLLRVTPTYDFWRTVTITTAVYHIAEKLAQKNLLQTVKNAKGLAPKSPN